jgi:transposase
VATTAEAPALRTLKSRVAKLYTPSQKAEILEHAATHGITEASKKFGVSLFAVYAWHRKVAKAATGAGPSPTTGLAPKDLEAQRDKEILDEWHRHPGLGPSQIRNQLRRNSIKVSVNTARRRGSATRITPPLGQADADRGMRTDERNPESRRDHRDQRAGDRNRRQRRALRPCSELDPLRGKSARRGGPLSGPGARSPPSGGS